MDLRRFRPALLLSAWTLLVWTTRIRNIWTDDSLTTSGQVWRTVLAGVFTAFAVVTIGAWLRARGSTDTSSRLLPPWIRAFAVWTIAVWSIRAVQIGGADHGFGFKVVHTVLAVVSVALALWADRVASQTPRSSTVDA